MLGENILHNHLRDFFQYSMEGNITPAGSLLLDIHPMNIAISLLYLSICSFVSSFPQIKQCKTAVYVVAKYYGITVILYRFKDKRK